MPIVQIHMLEGRDIEKKRKLVKQVTEAVCDSLGVPASKVRIIIDDMKHDNYSLAGVLEIDEKKA